MKLTKRQHISKLKKEFSKLQTGYTKNTVIDFSKLNVNKIKLKTKLCWQENNNGFIYTDLTALEKAEFKIQDQINILIDNQEKEYLQVFNEKIKKFISKCNKVAKSLGCNSEKEYEKFFESIVN